MIFKKEKEVVGDMIEHINAVEASAKTAMKSIETYLEGDIDKSKDLQRKVDDIETQADLIRYGIRDRLYSGAYLPLYRESVYKLVESMDKVSNAAEACCDFFLGQRIEIPDSLKPQFVAICRACFGIVAPLRDAMLTFIEGDTDVSGIQAKAKQVGFVESNVDEMEWELTREIFTSSLEYAHKVHLKLCLDTIVEIADRAEDAADELEMQTVKAMV
jgi:predicted phosphate transport protein (TIGR00153 family)